MSAGTPASAIQPVSVSPFLRVVNTFIAPTKALAGLQHQANWIVPWLLISIVSLAFMAAVDFKVGFNRVAENQIKMSPRSADQMDKLSPEQRAERMQLTTTIIKYSSYGSPVISLVWFVIVAAVLMGTFKLGAGADISFRTSLAVVLYANLPGILRALIGIVSLFAGVDPEGFNIQNPVATNPGVLIDPTSSPILFRFLSGFDIFTFWILALMAVGFSCVTKLKRSTAFAGVFGWYVVVWLAGVGIAAIFS